MGRNVRCVIENRVQKGISGPKRDEVIGELRRLHNKEIYDLYCSANIVRVIKSSRMRWARNVASMGERRGLYRVLVGTPDGKRQLGRSRRRWEDNIKTHLQEVGWETWNGLLWLRKGTGCGLL